MSMTFPPSKEDFTAENGVTYTWDENRWRTKAYKLDDAELANYVTTEAFTEGQGKQDQLISDNSLSIKELEVTKGPVARYECKDTSLGIASRNGELYVNSPNASEVTVISFAPFDLNGNPTRPVAVGDIIEFVEDVSTNRSTGEVSRYRVESGDDSNALEVVYLNGANDFVVGEVEDVYIYPQNGETASLDYVNQQDALKVDRTESNEVSSRFRITGGGGTYFSTAGDELGLYHLKTPTDDGHAANKLFVDNEIAKVVEQIPEEPDLSGYLPLTGGTMTGKLEVAPSGTEGQYLLSVIAQGLPKDRQVAFRVIGDGSVKAGHADSSPFMASAANDVVTKGYLDAHQIEIPEDDGKVVVPSGTFVPTLQQGEMFLNTATKIVHIGA